MQRLIAVRLIQGLVALFIVSIVVFALSRSTGSPLDLMLPPEATQHDRDVMVRSLGLNKPLPQQYFTYISHLAMGDLGSSLKTSEPVSQLYLRMLPNTAKLASAAIVFVILTSIPLGVLAALKKDTLVDWLSRLLCTLGMAVPVFWLGLVLMQIFAVNLGWLPAAGMGGPKYFVLPAVTLGSVLMAGISRLLRSGMIDALDTEYVKLLRLKGISEARVLLHVVRNAAIAPLTFLGQYVGLLLGGTVVVEVIFTWPGVGRLAYAAIMDRDFPVIQGVIMINAAILILANLIVDILYAYVDPRIKSSI